MSVSSSVGIFQRPEHAGGINTRLLGTLGLFGGPMLFASFLIGSLGGMKQDNPIVYAVGILYLMGWMCSAVGLRRLRVTGDGAFAKGLFVVQIVGLCLAIVFNILEACDFGYGTVFFGITDAAWPLSHLLMIVVGIATINTGLWRGWRRFTPLLCGLVLPIALTTGAVFGRPAMMVPFGVLTTTAFTLLAWAVRTSGDESGLANL
jgi:hypothetical protein